MTQPKPSISNETLGDVLRQLIRSVTSDVLIEAGLVKPAPPPDRSAALDFVTIPRDKVNITIDGKALTEQDEDDTDTLAFPDENEDEDVPGFEFDSSGYPTHATLERIRLWPYDALPSLMNFISQGWRYTPPKPALIDQDEDPIAYALFLKVKSETDLLYRAATIGWSGNEDIIRALRMNPAMHARWLADITGGVHYWTIPRK